ncbi:MAG: hypothetical protein KDB71_05715 [Mycobacterium sp.]|nr:hypothetical protein [Mycobacterium sp.]
MTAHNTVSRGKRRSWPLIVAVLAVVLMVVLAMVVFGWTRAGVLGIGPRPAWQPPPQTRLSSSMHVPPVPGWRLRASNLGLPTRFATSDDPQFADPFIGNVDNHAYFLAGSPTATGTQWWVAGIDVESGKSMFKPVPLNIAPWAPQCFLNGPTALLCIDFDGHRSQAWVIDVPAGRQSFSGPTDLRTIAGHLEVKQIGIYAVAQTSGQGVYGIGPKAQTTWFVPGAGSADYRFMPDDFAPQTLVTQNALGRGATRMVVFRVSDGHVFEPVMPEGANAGSAAVYPGGFALEVRDDRPGGRLVGVNFYDDDGKQLGHIDSAGSGGSLQPGAVDLPIVESGRDATVYSADGTALAQIQDNSDELLIGDRLFFEAFNVEQYDLSTGTRVEPCKFGYAQSSYVGTDGVVGVFEKGGRKVAMKTYGLDLATCKTLWTTTSRRDAFHYLWRVNTTLVQLSEDATELMSLVAPRS